MRKHFFVLCAFLLAGIGAGAQITSGDYMIVNTETDQFLYGGYNWGCRASLGTKPVFFTVTPTGTNTYTLSSKQWTGDARYMYLSGSDFYCDSGTATNITVEETESGVYTISYNGSYMYAQDGKNAGTTTTATASTASHWKFVSLQDVIDSMEGASSTNPVDVTALIDDANFKAGGNGLTAANSWTKTDGVTIGNYSYDASRTANCAEAYHVLFSISQTLTDLKAGWYSLSAQGFYRSDGGTEIPVMFVDDQTVSLPVLVDGSAMVSGGDWMWTAYSEFLDGLHPAGTIEFFVDEDGGSVTIGFKNSVASNVWNCFGELELLYYGTEAPALPAHECEADIDHWTTTGNNGSHEVNDWSTEGESDGSGMVTPFCQNWVWSGDTGDNVTLTAATISHETLTGLTPGEYTVSMDIRIYSEKGNTITSGTTFNANNASEDIVSGSDHTDGTYNSETEVYGTYTLTCIVYDDGTLDISIVIPDGVSYNWIAWKNLSVTYSGPVTEPSIGKAKVEKTVVTPGEEVTITFQTAAPEGGNYTLSGQNVSDDYVGTVSYVSGGVFTFTVPSSAKVGDTFTITLPAGTLAYSGDGTASSTEQTLTFTVPYVLSEELMSGMFLKNLYAGDLLSRGKDLGTRADADFIGIPVTLTMNDEGKYTIWYADADQSRADATHQSYLYGPNWVYADGSASDAATFSIEEVYAEDGTTLLGYHFVSDLGYLYRYDAEKANATDTDDNYALALNGNKGDNYSDDNQAIWTFVTATERDAIKAAWVEEQKLDVAEKAGLTGITSAAEFDAYVAEQTQTEMYSSTLNGTEDDIAAEWTVQGNHGYSTSWGVETYQGYGRLSKTIGSLPPGIYKITLNGLDRNSDNDYSWEMYQAGYTDLSESYLYANEHEVNLKAWGTAATRSGSEGSYSYDPNGMEEASNKFDAGSYQNELYTYVGDDGELYIQIATLVTEYFGWATVKDLHVYYLGELDFGEDKDYDEGDEVTFDGTTYAVVTGENLFVNGGFNEGVTGWTAGSGYTGALSSSAVNITWSGGYNDLPYITLPSAVGASNEATPTQAIKVTPGKSYLFVGYTKGTAPDEGNLRYSALFEASADENGNITEKNHTEGETSYSNTIIQLEWGNPEDELNGWTKTEGVFTVPTAEEESTYSYVGMRMNWSTGSYDGFQLYEVEEPTEIEWTLGAEYGTLILPFAYDLSGTSLTAYTGAINGDVMELTAVDGNAVAAYTPYIIGGATEAQTTYTFSGVPGEEPSSLADASGLTGVLVDTYAPANSYVLQNQTGTPAFYLVESADSILVAAYHCYLDYTASGVKAITFSFGDDVTTGIEAVDSEAEAGSDVIYDLSGRRVLKAQKGVYIVNGRKVVIK